MISPTPPESKEIVVFENSEHTTPCTNHTLTSLGTVRDGFLYHEEVGNSSLGVSPRRTVSSSPLFDTLPRNSRGEVGKGYGPTVSL